MYVNPFERMRKKREDEEKKRHEVEKEKQKYARLGAQMGFTEDKAVVPSFIRSLIGESNKTNVPPFGNIDDKSFKSTKTNIHFDEEESLINQKPHNSLEEFEKQLLNEKQFSKVSEKQFDGNKTPFKFNNHLLNQSTNLNVSEEIPKDFNYFEFENLENKSNNLNQTFNPKTDLNNKKYGLNIENYFELFNLNEINNKLFILIDYAKELEKTVINNKSNLDNSWSLILDTNKVMLYSSPCLFLLKQFINGLPEIIKLEDKRALWERTSLLLAATEFGKTGSEIDFIVESLTLTKDPINMIIQEFKNLFYDYTFENTINLFILNAEKISKSKVYLILNFLKEILLKIPDIKIHLNLYKEILEIENDFDFFSEDIILINHQEEQIEKSYDFEKQFDYKENINSQIPKEINNKIPNLNNNFFEESQPNLENVYFKETEYEKPFINFESYDNSISNGFTGNIPGIRNQQKNHDYNYSNEFEFEKGLKDEPIEEEDSWINSKLRIRVNRVLEKQRDELEEQEKLEEFDRVRRKGNEGFNPYILSKQHTNKQQSVPIPFEKFSKDSKEFSDSRKEDEVQKKLSDFNASLMERRPINIKESSVNKNENNKTISVPGNWNDLNK